MWRRKTGWSTCASLLAVALALWCGRSARAAELNDEEKAAMEELAAIMKFDPQPKSVTEAMDKFKEVLPKVEALAEKNAKNEVGARALLVAAQLAIHLQQPDKARAIAKTFGERYPEHPLKGQFDAILAKLNEVGTEAKDFTTADLAGKAFKLSDFRGKVVLLDFFAGWCPPCRAEMPNLKALYAKYKDRGFEIVGISLDKTLDAAKEYVKKEGITWTAGFHQPGASTPAPAQVYGIRAIPAMWLLDKEGKIVGSGLRGKAVEAALERLFPPGKPPEPPGKPEAEK